MSFYKLICGGNQETFNEVYQILCVSIYNSLEAQADASGFLSLVYLKTSLQSHRENYTVLTK